MSDVFNPSYKKIVKRYLRDFKNIILYQRLAPLTHQLIYVDPKDILFTTEKEIGKKPLFKRKHSALVVCGDWDKDLLPIDEHPKIKACNLHFKHNLDWGKAGMYSLLLGLIEKSDGFDQCYSIGDVKKCYSAIDQLFEKVKSDKKLKARKDIIANNHREYDGIMVHIGRYGEPIFSGSSCHRLSMARALSLPEIPCELGVVHKYALQTDRYREIIQSSSQATR